MKLLENWSGTSWSWFCDYILLPGFLWVLGRGVCVSSLLPHDLFAKHLFSWHSHQCRRLKHGEITGSGKRAGKNCCCCCSIFHEKSALSVSLNCISSSEHKVFHSLKTKRRRGRSREWNKTSEKVKCIFFHGSFVRRIAFHHFFSLTHTREANSLAFHCRRRLSQIQVAVCAQHTACSIWVITFYHSVLMANLFELNTK